MAAAAEGALSTDSLHYVCANTDYGYYLSGELSAGLLFYLHCTPRVYVPSGFYLRRGFISTEQ